MNRVLRARHRVMVTVLAPVLPMLLVVALASRSASPRVARLPYAEQTTHDLARLKLDGGGIELEAWLDGTISPAVLWLRPVVDLREPDVLVYWVAPVDPGREEHRYLLGALAGTQLRRLPLPERYADDGRIELMSLAHGGELGSLDLQRLTAALGGAR